MVFHLVGISLWVGGLVAFLGLARQHVEHLPVIARRYSSIALLVVHRGGAVRVRQRLGADHLSAGPVANLRPAGAAQGRAADGLGVIGYLHRKRTLPAITETATGDR